MVAERWADGSLVQEQYQDYSNVNDYGEPSVVVGHPIRGVLTAAIDYTMVRAVWCSTCPVPIRRPLNSVRIPIPCYGMAFLTATLTLSVVGLEEGQGGLCGQSIGDRNGHARRTDHPRGHGIVHLSSAETR